MFIPKVCWSWVYLNSWFFVTSGTASRRSSSTIRIPSRSDSSRRSAMPSIFLSRTAWAIFSISVDLLTWYGISVTTSASRPTPSPPRRLISSSCIRARITTRPRPVRYASRTPPTPKMTPPVGKSGAGMWAISASSSISGSSM